MCKVNTPIPVEMEEISLDEVLSFDKELTVSQLLRYFFQLCKDTAFIKHHILEKDSTAEADQLLTVQDAAKFLSLAVPSIYGLIAKGQIPSMKRSSRVYFSKSELVSYLQAGKKKSKAEIETAKKKEIADLKEKVDNKLSLLKPMRSSPRKVPDK